MQELEEVSLELGYNTGLYPPARNHEHPARSAAPGGVLLVVRQVQPAEEPAEIAAGRLPDFFFSSFFFPLFSRPRAGLTTV